MLLFLFLLVTEPVKVIQLPREFGTISVYRYQIYLAPRFGKSIFRLDNPESITSAAYNARPEFLTGFTNDENYRIYGFQLTAFALYLNNGRAIEKFYFASGIKETIYQAKDIPAFIITPAEEVILADRKTCELVFLDFKNDLRLKKNNLAIYDLQFSKGIIYTLKNNKIIIIDEYGNIIGENVIPENLAGYLLTAQPSISFHRTKTIFINTKTIGKGLI